MEEAIQSTSRTRVRYGMLALIFVNVVINYLDRSNLSVAATALGGGLKLSSVQLGFIFSAFGWLYAGLQIPGRLLADRLRTRLLYPFCFGLSFLGTLGQGLAIGLISLVFFR